MQIQKPAEHDGGETHFHSSQRAYTLELIISMLATEFSRDLGEKEEGKMMGAIRREGPSLG